MEPRLLSVALAYTYISVTIDVAGIITAATALVMALLARARANNAIRQVRDLRRTGSSLPPVPERAHGQSGTPDTDTLHDAERPG